MERESIDSHLPTLWKEFNCFTGLVNLVQHIQTNINPMEKGRVELNGPVFSFDRVKTYGEKIYILKSTVHTKIQKNPTIFKWKSWTYMNAKVMEKEKTKWWVTVMVAYLLGCFGSLRNVFKKQMKNHYQV